MIFNSNEYSTRELLCNAVINVFGNATNFIDFLENEKYSIKYDCFLDGSGENYIINRETGEYINWYKLNHIGRCATISIPQAHENLQKWLEIFLTEFKNSGGTK